MASSRRAGRLGRGGSPAHGPAPDLASWERATAGLAAPLAIVDLPAFDANAADLADRAAGTPIRLASKSLRCLPLIRRALEHRGFSGVMAYSLPEALWLAGEGLRDLFVAYPTVDRAALTALAADARAAREITLAVDDPAQLSLLAAHRGRHRLKVAIDVDASLRFGPVHIGVRRSPLRSAEEAASLARAARAAGLEVAGVMLYEAQIAGLPDSSALIRLMKTRSAAELRRRRAAVSAAVREVAPELRFVNGGGTGSLHVTARDPAVTEVTAGSGLYGPTLFDGYRAFRARPAAAFALPVTRRPGHGMVTAFGGGYIASGPPGRSRSPLPLGGLRLLGTEGAGEVQTPLRGAGRRQPAIGDRVWFRHAKAGELAERFGAFHLLSGSQLVRTVPTYRGAGRSFG